MPGWPTSMWMMLRPASSAARAASITSITMKGSTSPRAELRMARRLPGGRWGWGPNGDGEAAQPPGGASPQTPLPLRPTS